MKFRGGYNFDFDENSVSSGLQCDPAESRTQQQFREECDINTIVRRFGLTGKVPVGFSMPQSGDFTGVSDFHSAMNLIVEAEEAFLKVPGEIRARFGHDPQQLMRFLEDEKNIDEATKLGFFKAKDEPRKEEGKP